MLHRLLWLFLSVQDGKLSEHRHVSTLKPETRFHQRDEFVKESIVFILLDEFLQLFGVDNKIETTDLSETELSLVNACLVDLLPDPVISMVLQALLCGVGFAGTVHGILVLAEMDQCRRQSSPVGDTRKENLGSLVQFFVVAFLADIKNLKSDSSARTYIRNVQRRKEIFE